MARPKIDPTEKKIATSFTLDPRVKAKLDAQARRKRVSSSSLLEQILRKVFGGG